MSQIVVRNDQNYYESSFFINNLGIFELSKFESSFFTYMGPKTDFDPTVPVLNPPDLACIGLV